MQSPGILVDYPLRSRLAHAQEAERLGDYDRAARLLEDRWPALGVRPRTDGLDAESAAELLLRAGALTGYLGSKAQRPDAQECALDLLTESLTIYSSLGMAASAAEAQIELAACYRRQGAYAQARDVLDGASDKLGEGETYLRALAAVRRIIVEISDDKLEVAGRLLASAGETVRRCENQALTGRFLNECGALLFLLSEKGGPPRWAEALEYFDASKRCVEAAGDLRYATIAENNIGYALAKLGRLAEARRHVARARRLALCVDDRAALAMIDDTEAQLLIEQDRLAEAEALSRNRIEEMAGTDHCALLAENLTTHAVALARMGRQAEAEEEFERAVRIAEFVGDLSGAERASALREAEIGQGKVLPFPGASQRKALSFEWRVADSSLLGIGIRKGDAVRFTVADRGRDGDIAAVVTQAGRFVKLIYLEDSGRVRLEGAHPRCPVRRFSRDEVTVLGVARSQPD